jgi:signal transduction histidine kinase
MKKKIFIVILLAVATGLRAQTNVDSLENVLKTQELTAEEKLVIYSQLTDYYVGNDLEKYHEYAKKAVEIGRENNKELVIASWTRIIGRYYALINNMDSAQICIEMSLETARKVKSKVQEAYSLADLSQIYFAYHKYDNALELLQQALKLYEELENYDMQLNMINNISNIHLSNNTQRAKYLNETGLKLVDKVTEQGKPCVAHLYTNICIVARDENDFDKALEYRQKAIDIYLQLNSKYGLITCYEDLANIYIDLEEYDKAYDAAKKSLLLAEELNSPYLFQFAWGAMAGACYHKDKYKESQEYSSKILETDSLNFSYFHYAIGSSIQLGEKETAIDYLDKFISAARFSSGEAHQQNLTEQEVKFETEKKELRITALEKEQQLYIWLGIASGIILLLIIILLIVRQRLNVRKRLLAEQQFIQLEQKQQIIAAQSALNAETTERARMGRDLHDRLGGMLSAVKLNLDNIENLNNARDMINQSIEELRRVAHHLMPESLLRFGLQTSLTDFCYTIPKVRFQHYGENIRYEENIEVVAYLCILELVNNAVKYSEAENINVQIVQDNNRLWLTVQDDGCGFDVNKIKDGMGLNNLRTRLSIIGGTIDILSEPGKGTEINVDILIVV